MYPQSCCKKGKNSIKKRLGPVHTPNCSWAEPNLIYVWFDYLIQTPILIIAELSSKGEKCSFRFNGLQNTLYWENSCIKSGTWKVRRLNQSRSKVAPKAKFPAGLGEEKGWAVPNWNRLSLLIQMPNRTFHVQQLIQCIRFGSWKVRLIKLGV